MSLSIKTDEQILALLGEWMNKERLSRQLQDKDVIERGGITKDALNSFKHGRPITTMNFIKILRGMDRLDVLKKLFPDALFEPVLTTNVAPKPKRIVKPKPSAKTKKVVWSE